MCIGTAPPQKKARQLSLPYFYLRKKTVACPPPCGGGQPPYNFRAQRLIGSATGDSPHDVYLRGLHLGTAGGSRKCR
jgi:hypothetical protein